MKRFIVLSALLLALFPSKNLEAREFNSRPHEFVGTPSRRISHNRIAHHYGLEFVRNDNEILALAEEGRLVQVRDTETYYVDPDMGKEYSGNRNALRYARPWVVTLLQHIGKAFQDRFFRGVYTWKNNQWVFEYQPRLKVGSLIRTPQWQRGIRIKQGNPNATTAQRCKKRQYNCSTHLTGSVVDISTKDLPHEQKVWLREFLFNLQRQELIAVVEEIKTNAFHVFVYPEADFFLDAHPFPCELKTN